MEILLETNQKPGSVKDACLTFCCMGSDCGRWWRGKLVFYSPPQGWKNLGHGRGQVKLIGARFSEAAPWNGPVDWSAFAVRPPKHGIARQLRALATERKARS